MEDFNYSVELIWEYYGQSGKLDQIEAYLKSARENIKSIPRDQETDTDLQTLKRYLSEVTAYFEFAGNPNCSFEQLVDYNRDYETNLRNYRSDLSFTYEIVEEDENAREGI